MIGSQFPADAKPPKSELDSMSPATIAATLERYRPTVLVHLAAMTDMLACENDPARAHAVNVTGTENITSACRERGIFLVYISTCAVFDGTKSTPYTERDEPNPRSVYGKTKLLGEHAALESLPGALVIRAGWLFGGGDKLDTHFVGKTIAAFKQNMPVTATNDRYGSPTFVPDFASAVRSLVRSRAYGVRHVVNDGVASYLDIANAIKIAGPFATSVTPMPAQNVENSAVYRGTMEALASETVRLRPWDTALREYIAHGLPKK